MSTEIIPAILPRDFAELSNKIEIVRGLAKSVQVDICDGQFVPNATWPYKKHDDSFEAIQKEEMGMPDWEDINYEFDLMCNQPQDIVGEWVIAGGNRIIVHVEAKGDVPAAIDYLQGKTEVGLAINIDTPIDAIEPIKDKISFVQCMGIDRIGFQGQSFNTRVIEKVKNVRAAYPSLSISVDGGVNLENARELINAGADRLVVGSAIFGSDNPIEQYTGLTCV